MSSNITLEFVLITLFLLFMYCYFRGAQVSHTASTENIETLYKQVQ